MSIEAITTFFAFSAAAGGLLMAFGMLGLRLTLTRRLNKQLSASDDQWDTGMMEHGLITTSMFAWACVLPPVQRTVRFRGLFPGLDIRATANWLEKLFAFGMVGGLMVLILCTVCFHLVKP